MIKVVLVGAGSIGWTRNLVRDILTFPGISRDVAFSLLDINPERLRYAKRAVEAVVEKFGTKNRVEATRDRAKAFRGASFVICTIQVGGPDIFKHDMLIPYEHGIDSFVGDMRSIAGYSRALRTIPVILDMVWDMERYCPDALFLNYVNPMSLICRAIEKRSRIRHVGLCHSVQGTVSTLARWLKVPEEEVDYVCAGMNHQAWYLKLEHRGRDLYPKLRRLIRRDSSIYRADIVRNEMFLSLDYYVTESGGHNSEYNWWFRKRPDIVKWFSDTDEWIAGKTLHALHTAPKADDWKAQLNAWFADGAPIEMARGREFAAWIINAWLTDEAYIFNGNLANQGSITNLPSDACVDVPVVVQRAHMSPVHVGALPPQCAALNSAVVWSEEMAVEAILTGDAHLFMQAIAYDPLCAATLSLPEIRKLSEAVLNHAIKSGWAAQFKG